MMRFLIAIILAMMMAAPLARSDSPPVTSFPAPWVQNGSSVSLAVSTSSSNIALGGTGQTTLVCNNGSNDAFVALGTSDITAATTGVRVPAGNGCVQLVTNGATYIAGITATSTSTLYISTGNGVPFASLPGGGGGAALGCGGINPCPPSQGGTGVSNPNANTLTLGGAFAMSGAFTFAGTLTGPTAVTFPTSGTLAALGAIQTFTGANTFSGIHALTGATLPTQAAGTLGIGGIATAPTLGANGEGDVYLSATNGLTLQGQGSACDLSFFNKSGAQVACVPTGTATLDIGRTFAENANEVLLVFGQPNNPGGATIMNPNSGGFAASYLYFGNNTSSTEGTITLNGGNNTTGNGVNSLTITATAGKLALMQGSTNFLDYGITTAATTTITGNAALTGQLTANSLATSGTATAAVCQVSGGGIVALSAGCGLGTGFTTAGTGLGQSGSTVSSNAVEHVSYQPGLLAAVNATKAVFHKYSKASTVDNLEGSAATFSCVSNPTITMFECGTSASCSASPTTIGTVTVTSAGTVVDGTVSAPAITAGDYVAFAMTAGTCASIDIAASAQVHSN